MSIRKIKDAIDLATNEAVFFKGHAKATYMSDGSTVEDAINNINQSGGTGNVDLSNYATKTEVNTELNKKQDKLVSGTNIKTINGTPILGSGDITIEGGSSTVDWENIQNKPDITHDEYGITIGNYSESLEMYTSVEIGGAIFVGDNGNEVSIGKGDGSSIVYLPKDIRISNYNEPYIEWYGINIHPDKITISYEDYSSDIHDFKEHIIYTRLGDGSKFLSDDGTYKIIRKEIIRFDNDSIVLKPNKYYILTATYPSLTITLDENGTSGEDANYVNEYCIQIPISATTTSVALPNNIKWANGEIPTFENGCTYQISIINGFGICTKFK